MIVVEISHPYLRMLGHGDTLREACEDLIEVFTDLKGYYTGLDESMCTDECWKQVKLLESIKVD